MLRVQNPVVDRAWNAIKLGRAGCCQVSCRFMSLLPSVLLRVVWIQSRESPVATSSANRDVSRFLLFPSIVASRGAGTSISVPVVMQVKGDHPKIIRPKRGPRKM